MSTAQASGRVSRRTPLRDRLLDAVAAAVISDGWARLRLAAIADTMGVSRQTVYNELGAKPDIAEALIAREAETFAQVINEQFDAHRDDLVAAVAAATTKSLQHAADSPLLSAVLRPAEGGEQLLPLRAIRSARVASGAVDVVLDRLNAYWPDLPIKGRERIDVVDALVRLVISHVTDPSDASPEEVGMLLAGMVRRLARP